MADTSYVVTYQDVVGDDGKVYNETKIHKEIFGGKMFFRVRLKDLVGAIGQVLTEKQFKVIEYMLKNVRVADNMFLGTVDEISKAIPASNKTVIGALKGMQKANLMQRVRSGAYQFNPEVLVCGDVGKEARLVIEYKAVKRKNELDCKSEPPETLGEAVDG